MKALITKTLIVLAASAAAATAQADGFICVSESGLNVKVFNRTQPTEGTRNVSTMIISDSKVGAGRKTIGVFKADKNTLSQDYSGAKYAEFIAKVDLRTTELKRKGEYLMGTRLGEVSTIHLLVDFTYGAPHAEELAGYLTAEKRNGEVVTEEAVCRRYLKGE